MNTMRKLKEHFGDIPKSNKFEINDNDLNIEVIKLDIDIENKTLSMTRVLVKNNIMDKPKDLEISFGGLRVYCRNPYENKVLRVSTLSDESDFITMDIETKFSMMEIGKY